MKKNNLFYLSLFTFVVFFGCHTPSKSIDLEPVPEIKKDKVEKEENHEQEQKPEKILENDAPLNEKEKTIEKEDEKAMVETEQKKIDPEKTIIYIERPVYRPSEEKNSESERKKVSGKEAVKAAMEDALKIPEKYSNGKMYYDFDENFVYEIYCAPYRITDIELEPGEEVLETPFVSEPEVWQIGAGVSKNRGLDVQHFFVKPSYSKLTSTMIIITNRRIYHLVLKSFSSDHMAMVKWSYPVQMPYTIKSEMLSQSGFGNKKIETVLEGISPEFLSFDYKMKYAPFRKPVWLPLRVYDDGRKTYIELNKQSLNTEFPTLFDNKRNIINYRVKKNIIIIDSLITKITLQLNKSRVIIEKKKQK